MTKSHFDTLIIGGGIGGLSTALAMGRAGRRVHLVEQAEVFSEIGAGLQLGPNATRSMDRLGILEDVLDIAVRPRAGIVMDAVSGEKLTSIDFGDAFTAHYGYPYVVAHRHDLLEILVAACQDTPRVTLENNRCVVQVTDSHGVATATFDNGDSYTADVLVGADGIRSRVRQLHDDSEPLFTGHVAYRGTLPIDQITSNVETDDIILWMGPGMHLIQYPVRRRALYNQVAVFESQWYAQGRDDWGSLEELTEVFAPACKNVQDSLALIKDNRKWPIFDRDPIESWSTPHTVLLGDGAHAMRQYLGQGACQAMEDALVLTRALDSNNDVSLAFKSYESARIERTTRCQLAARPWGDLWHTDDSTTLALRNRVFQMRAENDYSEFDWLFEDHVGD
ncbi:MULTISPECIES: FAD-dependent monooxygenase [unclassified Arthrobacter]|uniref:FAD-dependent monooxygenase n=1 Tax=unclassified Arthrobacter TaxID=235627 RepID=UPI000CE57439|nr:MULTISPECIES: FAD-dependent monooxygenase [unclassified Arthrobacter]